MKQISSRGTWFHKRVFPFLWFGFLAFFSVTAMASGAAWEDPVFLLMPIVMVVFGTLLFKALVWDLVDEVWDAGDYLVVRKRDTEERIPLSNIMNVSSSFTNPPRITLTLISAGAFGDKVVFSPARTFRLNPFAPDPVAEELMRRAHDARMRSRH